MTSQKDQSSKSKEQQIRELEELLYNATMQNKYLRGQLQGEKGRYDWLGVTNESLVSQNKKLEEEKRLLEEKLEQERIGHQKELVGFQGELLELSARISHSLNKTTTSLSSPSQFSLPVQQVQPPPCFVTGLVQPSIHTPPVVSFVTHQPNPVQHQQLLTPSYFLQPPQSVVVQQSHVGRLQHGTKTKKGIFNHLEVERQLLKEVKKKAPSDRQHEGLPNDKLEDLSKADLIKRLKVERKQSQKKSESLEFKDQQLIQLEEEHQKEKGQWVKRFEEAESRTNAVLHRRVQQNDGHMSMFN